MSNNKPFAYYDTLHDKLLWAEGPQYVHAQRTEGMSLKPLYLHPSRPEPSRNPMTGEEIENIYYSGLTFVNSYLAAFVKGFRQAEKHHGIGVDDE